jgi:predicted MFS family arabinose efflux permease
MTRETSAPGNRRSLNNRLVAWQPALRSRQYRNYMLFSLTSLSGQQVVQIAMAWLIYDLTESGIYLALLGVCMAVPGIAFSLFGGVMADRLDVRRLLSSTQLFMTGIAAVLFALTAAGLIEPWHVLVAAFLTGAGQAFNNPARQAIYPQLVAREDLSSAVNLNSMVWQSVRILAPAAGGVLIAVAGISVAFFACAAGYLPFALFVRTLDIERATAARGVRLQDALIEGPRYVLANPLFTALIGLTFFNSFFGTGLFQIFPMIANEVLDVGPSGLGFMYSAMGIGSLTGLILASVFGKNPRTGQIILTCAAMYGFVILLFAVSTVFWAALVALFLMGGTSQFYMVMVQTALQMEVPDELRGRVMGLYTMTYNMGPLGATQSGGIAAAVSPAAALTVGGLAIIALAIYLTVPSSGLRSLRAEREAVAA